MSLGVTKSQSYSGEFRSTVIRPGSSADAFTIMTINISKLPLVFNDLCNVFIDATIMFSKYTTTNGRHVMATYTGGMQKSMRAFYDPTLTYPFSNTPSQSATATRLMTYKGGDCDPDMSFQIRTGASTDLDLYNWGYYIPDNSGGGSANVLTETVGRLNFSTRSTKDISTAEPNSVNINCASLASTANYSLPATTVINYSCIAKVVVVQANLYGA
jgi:hypothetical protein